MSAPHIILDNLPSLSDKRILLQLLDVVLLCQTLGSELNGVDRQRDFLVRHSCSGGRSSPPSVDLDARSFVRSAVPVSGSATLGGLNNFRSAASEVDLPGADLEEKPGADAERRSTVAMVGRSPGSNKSVGGISTSAASSTGNSSAAAMYETGTGSDVKHHHHQQQLDYISGGGGAAGGLLASDPLHYYPHLGGVASSPGFSPYPGRHHPHPTPHHHHITAAAAAYQPYAMPDLDYTSTSAFFHSNVFKAAAAASQIRTKSHSSSGWYCCF